MKLAHRSFPLLLSMVFLATTCANTRAEDSSERQQVLDASLRQLEKDIAAVRGLEFKSPVVARIIARPKDAGKQIQGFYSIKDKALFVYDDIKGSYERGVLIHEMVHALQDQHFGLKQLHQSAFNSDADLAMSALIEGDATYTMIEIVKKDQPRVTAMLDAPLEKARDIQNAFLYAQGARYVKALKERGGWAAVNRAYQFSPRSTAAVLHPEGVSTIDLGPGATRGELGILRMFAAHPETAPLAVKAAAGWKADCEVLDGDSRRWVVAFATRDHALEFQQAMTKLKLTHQPDLKSFLDEPGANAWKNSKGAVHAVLTREDRVFVLQAPNEAGYKTLLDRLEGPPSLVIYDVRQKRKASFGEMVEQLLEADVVCIGEKHDSEPHHRVQLQIIRSLYARDERLGVGMEMFQRPFQNGIDAYFQGKSGEEEFLKATEYRQRWGFDWGLYRPIVEFCRKNSVPIAALNAPRELTSKVAKSGWQKLTDDERKQLGEIDFQVKEHRDYWFERLPKLHGKTNATEDEKERSYQVMTVWDGYMAASAAQFQQSRRVRRMVVLAGAGHVERGFGIPARMVKQTGGRFTVVRVESGGDLEKLSGDPAADFIVIVQ